jgi:hypothetical protein
MGYIQSHEFLLHCVRSRVDIPALPSLNTMHLNASWHLTPTCHPSIDHDRAFDASSEHVAGKGIQLAKSWLKRCNETSSDLSTKAHVFNDRENADVHNCVSQHTKKKPLTHEQPLP